MIMSFAPSELPLEGIETDLRREVVRSFSVLLIVLWQKGYTAKLIRTINSVKKKVGVEWQEYHEQV